jgi:hypothetical protein
MRGFYIKLAAFDLSHWCTDQTPQFPRSFHVKPTSEALPLPPYSDTTRGLFFPHSDRLFNHTSMVVLLIDMLAVELYVQLKRSMRPCYDLTYEVNSLFRSLDGW